MTTLNLNDLLDPTMIFLVAGSKVRSMTCRLGEDNLYGYFFVATQNRDLYTVLNEQNSNIAKVFDGPISSFL